MAGKTLAKRPRGDRRERTRGRLIEAASELIRQRGYEGFVLDEVAMQADVTRRTVYDHFRNKEELVVAVVSRRRAEALPAAKPGVGLRTYLRSVARAIIRMSRENPSLGRATASFELYAHRNPAMRRRVLATNRELYGRIEKNLLDCFGRQALAMPARRFVRILHALVDGMIARCCLMPEEFTDDVVMSAFDCLARDTR